MSSKWREKYELHVSMFGPPPKKKPIIFDKKAWLSLKKGSDLIKISKKSLILSFRDTLFIFDNFAKFVTI